MHAFFLYRREFANKTFLNNCWSQNPMKEILMTIFFLGRDDHETGTKAFEKYRFFRFLEKSSKTANRFGNIFSSLPF